MTPKFRTSAVALATLLLLGACSSSPSGSRTPAAQGSTAASTPAASAPAASAPAASEATPGANRAHSSPRNRSARSSARHRSRSPSASTRGDCDYWLTTAKDSKVEHRGVHRRRGHVLLRADEGHRDAPGRRTSAMRRIPIFNESIGTVVVARKGDAVVAVQVFAGAATEQLSQATALVEAILAASLTP